MSLSSTLFGAGRGASARCDALGGIGHSPLVQHRSVCLVGRCVSWDEIETKLIGYSC